MQLQQVGRSTAVVAGDDDFVRRNFEQFGKFVEDQLLDGVVALQVGRGGQAELFRGCKHSSVFAGAVIFEGVGFAFGNRTLQGGGFDIGAPEDIEDLADLVDLALVRTADDGEVTIGQIQAFDGAAAGDANGLKRLEGTADEAFVVGLPSTQHDPSAIVTKDGVSMVDGFDDAFTQESNLEISSVASESSGHS